MHWDKELTKKLVDNGLSWEHARIVVGIVAEERQNADIEGYKRDITMDIVIVPNP